MEKKELNIHETFTVQEISITLLIKVCLKYWHNSGNIAFLYIKRPYGIMLDDGKMKKTIKLTDDDLPLDEIT
jgi:hypothetical protein